MHESRYLGPGDDQAYGRVGGYSYNLAPAVIVEMCERARVLGDLLLGSFTPEGELGAAMIDRRMTLNLNGRRVSANGVGMVASAPETRRRGMVRDMLAWHLERLNEDGVALSLLYPFQYRFYQRMGWGYGNQVVQVGIPPKEFGGYGCDVGSTRLLMTIDAQGQHLAEGYAVEQVIDWMQSVYEFNLPMYNLAAYRSRDDWQRALRVNSGLRYIYGWWDPNGVFGGYVICGTRDNEYPTTLRVREMFAVSAEGWRGLCWFLGCHDSHIKLVQFHMPVHVQLLELLVDPQHDAKLSQGQMVRAVNVARLLEARGAAGAGDGACVLQVRDELAAWNDGTYLVEVSAGQVKAAKMSAAGPAREPDVSVPIDVFSQLAVGTRSLGEMARFGLARVKAGPGAEVAAGLFPAKPIWHLEYY